MYSIWHQMLNFIRLLLIYRKARRKSLNHSHHTHYILVVRGFVPSTVAVSRLPRLLFPTRTFWQVPQPLDSDCAVTPCSPTLKLWRRPLIQTIRVPCIGRNSRRGAKFVDAIS